MLSSFFLFFPSSNRLERLHPDQKIVQDSIFEFCLGDHQQYQSNKKKSANTVTHTIESTNSTKVATSLSNSQDTNSAQKRRKANKVPKTVSELPGENEATPIRSKKLRINSNKSKRTGNNGRKYAEYAEEECPSKRKNPSINSEDEKDMAEEKKPPNNNE